MLANVAQEIDVIELVQPVGIIRHNGIAAGVFKLEEFGKDRADADQIVVDVVFGQNPAALVLAGRVADPRRAAAHQGDRPVAGLLQPVQHHDRQQRADMQRGGGAVEADISGNLPGGRLGIQNVRLGDLVDKAPFAENVKKVGFIGSHVSSLAPGHARLTVPGGVSGPGPDSTSWAVKARGCFWA